jgi:hypothetical protein
MIGSAKIAWRHDPDALERRQFCNWDEIVQGISDGAEAVGIGADTASTIAQVAAPALVGAGGGALASAIGGANPLYGALGGGALGALYGGYNAAGGMSGIKDALGIGNGTASSPLPGAVSPADYSKMTPEQQVAADVTAAGGGANPYGAASTSDTVSKFAGADPTAAGPAAAAKGINNTSLALGALAALGSALGKNGQTNQSYNNAALPGPDATAATKGPIWNLPANPTGYINRTPTTPASLPGTGYNPNDPSTYKSFFSYGPEPLFYSGNQLNLGKGFADGGPTGEDHAGGHEPMFDTGRGDRYVSGPGDGQSDSVPARLADGEFVWDATTVSRLGNGSNAAGARKLEAARRAIAHDSGSEHVVQKKITKSPLQYLAGAT